MFGILHLRSISRELSDNFRSSHSFVFLCMSFALKNISCLSDWPCFGPTTGILRNDVARVPSEIVVVPLKCCGTPRSPQISSTVEEFAIGALKFRRIPKEFEDLCAVHVDEYFLRFLAELVDLLLFDSCLYGIVPYANVFSNISMNSTTVCCLCSSCC